MPLQIEMRQERTITVIRLTGAIQSHDGASVLTEFLSDCLKQGQKELLLEVREVHSVDGDGIAVLRTSQAEARQNGGELRLAGPRYFFLAALALHGSTKLFPYYSSSEHALAGFADYPGTGGVKHFDILEFVREQEREAEGQPSCEVRRSELK